MQITLTRLFPACKGVFFIADSSEEQQFSEASRTGAVIPISLMRKLRPREERLARGHVTEEGRG